SPGACVTGATTLRARLDIPCHHAASTDDRSRSNANPARIMAPPPTHVGANSTGLPNSCLLLDSALKGCIGVRICTAGPNIVKLPIRTGQTSRTTQRPVRAPSGRTVQSSSRNAIRWRFQGNSARGERAHNALLPVAQKPESELDVKLAAVLVPRPRDDRRAVQARLSRLDGALVAAPMRRAQMFRDDEVEAFANRLARGV